MVAMCGFASVLCYRCADGMMTNAARLLPCLDNDIFLPTSALEPPPKAQWTLDTLIDTIDDIRALPWCERTSAIVCEHSDLNCDPESRSRPETQRESVNT
jgi:hypothetical protein